MSEALPELSRLGIGKVLDELRAEFPELTITKIRYLESEGLLDPERTPAGYRKFSFGDIERLRFILRQQRDKFWPLSHIRQVLDDMDRGEVPDSEPGVRVPRLSLADDGLPTADTFAEPPSQVRLSRDDLLATAGIDSDTLEAIEEFGLIRRRSSQAYYDGHALSVAALVAEFSALGLEPRHLRTFRAAAEREVALFEQVLSPRARQDGSGGADETAAALAALSVRLHTVLVRDGLRG